MSGRTAKLLRRLPKALRLLYKRMSHHEQAQARAHAKRVRAVARAARARGLADHEDEWLRRVKG